LDYLREAIIEDTPGVTRDRVSYESEWNGKSFVVVDTGGWEPTAEGIALKISDAAESAIVDADLVLFVVDAQVGQQSDDDALISVLRKSKKPVMLIANKVDSDKDELEAHSLWNLGLGEPHFISAAHGRGSGDLLDLVVGQLPEVGQSRMDDGYRRIAIVGRPNVGKSSLMNYLAKRPIAIVSDIPGTTRDLIRITLDISGYAVELIDTAGIRETNDAIESIGVNLAKDTLSESDLILILVTRDDVDSYSDFIENFDIAKHILIINKVDDECNSCYVDINDRQYLQISVKNHCNLSEIIKIIESKIENIASTNSSIITTQRQRFILEKTYTELNIILNNEYQFIDIMTEDIRSLIEHMNELIGDVTNDDVLDKLFYNFCIGK